MSAKHTGKNHINFPAGAQSGNPPAPTAGFMSDAPPPPEAPRVCYAPFMAGFAKYQFSAHSPVQRTQRPSAARRGLALELLHRLPPPDSGRRPSVEDAKLICPTPAAFNDDIRRKIGLCDRMFRTSKDPVRGLPPEGAMVRPTPFFEQACACFRRGESAEDSHGPALDDPDFEVNFEATFQAFTEAVRGKRVPRDAYGVAGDVVRIATECKHQFKEAVKYTRELIEEVGATVGLAALNSETRLLFDEAASMIDETIRRLYSARKTHAVSAFYQKLEARELSLKRARSTLGLLESIVEAHVAKRVADGHAYLCQMGDDAFARMAQHLDPNGAAALMGTCAEYSRCGALKSRMPHMHVRVLMGNFPHVRAISHDREALAQNQSKSVMRDFVLVRKAVRLYVDFVLPTLRAQPLKKRDRADGLSNLDHEFSEAEFEEPPESARRRGPRVSEIHSSTTEWGRRQVDAEQRKRSIWAAAEGPEEKHDRFMYNQRVPFDKHFCEPLSIAPSLVFADDHLPVPCSRFEGGLELSNQLLRDGGRFSQPPRWQASDCMPAVAKFHIPHLSLDHGGRLFCLKLTATGTLARSGVSFTLVVYSRPFEVVSKLDVVKRAGRRRTADQLKEACKRAKSGAHSA